MPLVTFFKKLHIATLPAGFAGIRELLRNRSAWPPGCLYIQVHRARADFCEALV